MEHDCKIEPSCSVTKLISTTNAIKKLKTRLRNIVLVSPDNPGASKYFRSERALRDEKQRQLNIKCPWVIHPLSKFRAWYEMFLIVLYFSTLLFKPVDASFANSVTLFNGYREMSITLDMLCWIDIFFNFWTGYDTSSIHGIELRPNRIAKHYMWSPFFICDVLSSIPRNLAYYIVEFPNRPILGVINVLSLLKFSRIFTLINLIHRTSQYLQIRSRGAVFIISASLVTFLVIHWLSCFQFLIPRLTGIYFASTIGVNRESWIYKHGINEKKWSARYSHCFFKGSAEILVILAMHFLNSRNMEIKFVEIINQVEEYMAQKQLPFDLRKRIIQFYNFKYQKKYFKDTMITNMFSSRLRKEVNVHLCKSLISSVPLFSELSMEEAGTLVTKFTPEIFLPKDTILLAASKSDTLYFISSGTVALYTHSGQEICHLQDGGFFGEICLILKSHMSQITVVAIEITQIYKLKKADFDQCFSHRKDIYHRIIRHAESSLKTVRSMEETYKSEMMRAALQQGSSRNVMESMPSVKSKSAKVATDVSTMKMK
ncbi:potassium/sodium hyperpolarization-activated cyclic nucleotide-gated channel 2 isoform X2 [Leptinotarsa decemlineata]|uniref:potassium/sodium hyperpolarization-activated cyclic nucleotide-gated channel 2 isoform X2 n=1 Tax=Leptinotarsa decemlineata TaxID=7539 RepID=UPI003D304C2E